MFQKLHIQLTLFCTFICGIILAFMSFICLSVSETELKERNFAEFQININMLVNHLENQNIISHNWLSQFCADTQFEVDIRDNGLGCDKVEAGFGLRHMRERLELLGGSLTFGNRETLEEDGERGFYILVSLPIREKEEEA